MSSERGQVAANIGTAFALLALVFGLMFVAEVGIGETFQIITDPSEVNAQTNSTFSGGVSMLDRMAVTGLVITMIGPAGLGIYKASSSDPEAIRKLQKHSGWLIAAVGVIGFWSIIVSVWDNSYDWNTLTDAQNAFNGFLASATAVGILQFFNMKR
jgi:hypothetical protein